MLNTKQDYRDCLMNIISPLKKYYTPGKAGVKCGVTAAHYGEKSSLMEAFARVMWGLGPFWGGGGEDADFEKIYLQGIINGTDPSHEEYWGVIPDFEQKIVETAALGLSLALAPHKLWDPLTDKQKDNLYNWLSQVNAVKSVDNNWQFFSVLVNLGFKRVGRPYDAKRVAYSISRFEEFYLGNGWYSDGNTDQRDYYISFAMHFYSLIYAKIMENDDPKMSDTYKKRAEEFGKDFIYWFDESGASLAFGRSLTYRFAQCCFWSACAFSGARPFPIGVIKGIISRHLEHWLSLPIFDNGGVLSIGYGYPNIGMSEKYNAFGSPYWALKSFLLLAIDDDDEFFTAEPLPLPQLDKIHVIPEARMVIQRMNGYVTALTAGQWAGFEPTHTPEKYSKFAYTSKYAFSTPRSYVKIENAGTDSMLAFVEDDICYVRRKCIEYRINDDKSVYSKWSPCRGITVETTVIPTDDGHIRKHIIESDRDIVAYDCAFATPEKDAGKITGEGELETIQGINTNLMKAETYTKAVKYDIKAGKTELVTTVVYPD